ncbi:zinc ribbon-containing protein [Halorhodospira neutriphila]|uniref:Zinc ribbon-containing protein n=1 Tax=Halorhodospira neutriphila TaxID=168379 RepID=A0ABS1E172_9GAMM|nr:zinc ribbon-containing protein [Halorhodospira neutriphila]MBK1725478.1 hypothetical protein [Halorhodospira neutriphila]
MSEEQDPSKRGESHHLLRGYERMLERLRERFAHGEGQQHAPRLREALEHVKERAVALGEMTREEAEHVGEYLRRDVEEAGGWLAARGRDQHLGDWLRMDLQMLESWLWEAFSSVADRTELELRGFTTTGEPSVYHTGEIAGPGTLVCMACGREVTFARPAHIPPCPGCHHTQFVRPTQAGESGDQPEE